MLRLLVLDVFVVDQLAENPRPPFTRLEKLRFLPLNLEILNFKVLRAMGASNQVRRVENSQRMLLIHNTYKQWQDTITAALSALKADENPPKLLYLHAYDMHPMLKPLNLSRAKHRALYRTQKQYNK